ncbi:MAG: hypothetical protein D4R64_10535 [Porphyromonadaceae bacterium]|nr:MAG: hypothetical protein D4R64_10535 [Porphyromonadaceae bacterium]
MKRLILIFTLAVGLAFTTLVCAQIGGTAVYQLLNLPPSARSAALGGLVPGAWDDDPALVYHNPALANRNMNNQLSLNYSNYLADIRYGYLAFSHDLGKWGTPVIGMQYINYGTFIEANEYGDILGNFSAAEYSLNLSYSYSLDSLLSVGITIRPIYSVLERYTSWGLGSDFGIHYHSANNQFAFTLVARNFGTQLTTYATPDREKLPFEVITGINFKLKHAPFRLHFTARNLQQYNLRPASEVLPADATFMKKSGHNIILALDHLVAGVEFVPGNLLAIRIGYNFLRRTELRMAEYGGATGFSFGAGLNFGKIIIDYALASYHVSGLTHSISLHANLNKKTKS